MIKLVCIGKLKDKNLSNLIDSYVEKIGHYHKIEIIEVRDEPISDNEKEVLKTEAKRVLDKINDDEYVILLDLHGQSIDSLSLAKLIDKLFISNSKICFVIGGSLGLDDSLRKRANSAIKLSDLTFLHQMSRLIILEQIYRSFKILNNEKYHK